MATYDWLYTTGHVSNITGAAGNTFLAIGGGSATIPTATEARSNLKVRASFTAKKAYVNVVTNTRGSATTVKTRKNTADGTISVSCTASTTGEFSDTTHTDSPAATDVYNWEVSTAGASGNFKAGVISLVLEDAVGNPHIVASSSALTTNPNLGNVLPYGGLILTASGTEAQTQYKIRTSTVLSNMYVFVSTATSFSSSCQLRKNAANGSETVTPGTSTGAFEDTTHTDSISATDKVNIANNGNTTNAPCIVVASFLSTSTAQQLGGGTAATSYTADEYLPLSGPNVSTTESDTQGHMNLPMKAQNLMVNCITNGRASSATIVGLRDAGATSAVQASCTASTTGVFEDTTNTVVPAADDKLNFIIDVGAGTGNFGVTSLGIEWAIASTTYTKSFSRVGAMTLAFNRNLTAVRTSSRTGAQTLAFNRKGNPFARTVTRAGAITLAFSRAGSTFKRSIARTGAQTMIVSRTKTYTRTLTRSGVVAASFVRVLTSRRTLNRTGTFASTYVRALTARRTSLRVGAMNATVNRAGSTYRRTFSRVGAMALAFATVKVKPVSFSRAGSMTAFFVRHGVPFKRTLTRTGTFAGLFARIVTNKRSVSRAGAMTMTTTRLVLYRRSLSRSGAMTALFVRHGGFNRTLSRVGTLVFTFARRLTYVRFISRAGTHTYTFTRIIVYHRSISRSGAMVMSVTRGSAKAFGFTRIGSMTATFSYYIWRLLIGRVFGADVATQRDVASDTATHRLSAADFTTYRDAGEDSSLMRDNASDVATMRENNGN